LQETSVVDDAINNGGCHVVVWRIRCPSGEFEVGGEDEAAILVGLGDDLEQQSGPIGVDG
jgi:hypothetical protein